MPIRKELGRSPGVATRSDGGWGFVSGRWKSRASYGRAGPRF